MAVNPDSLKALRIHNKDLLNTIDMLKWQIKVLKENIEAYKKLIATLRGEDGARDSEPRNVVG